MHFFKERVEQVIANLGLPEKTVEEIQEEKMIFDVFAEAAALFRKAGRKEYGS